MSNFKTQIDLTDNGNGSYSVEYTVFSPGKRYVLSNLVKTQISSYNSATNELPGIRVELSMDEDGPGNPFAFNGVFEVLPPLVINADKPFLEVVFKAWDSASQTYKDKGRGIVRGHIPN